MIARVISCGRLRHYIWPSGNNIAQHGSMSRRDRDGRTLAAFLLFTSATRDAKRRVARPRRADGGCRNSS